MLDQAGRGEGSLSLSLSLRAFQRVATARYLAMPNEGVKRLYQRERRKVRAHLERRRPVVRAVLLAVEHAKVPREEAARRVLASEVDAVGRAEPQRRRVLPLERGALELDELVRACVVEGGGV